MVKKNNILLELADKIYNSIVEEDYIKTEEYVDSMKKKLSDMK